MNAVKISRETVRLVVGASTQYATRLARSPEEVRAILAHEFAHLSRAHGRFSHWIYRLRRSWEHVFQQFSRPRAQGEVSLRPIVVKCVDYFWPRFNAHAFVLSRANEYEADALAARLREHKEELFNLRFQAATGQLDNNRRLRTVRRDIARIYTIMRERELGLSAAPVEVAS